MPASTAASPRPAGRVDLTWSVTRTQQGLTLVLDWKESGGPAPKRSRRPGFGSRLINMVIERQLNGQVEQSFGPEGLEAKLTVPLTHERWPGGARATAHVDLRSTQGVFAANVSAADVAQIRGWTSGPLKRAFSKFLLRVLIGIDDVAGLVLRRPQDHLVRGVAELVEIVAAHALELGEELPRLRPFAVLAVGDLARTVENLLAWM